MIQTILLFALGFLSAGFLALLAAPVLWRRAVSLTRRRVEASVPLSQSEIEADKDRLRADFAMSARRLEMSVKALNAKVAGRDVEISRQREALKDIAAERSRQDARIATLEAQAEEHRVALERRQEELAAVSARLAEAEARAAEKARALEEMSGMYEEASYASSSRQIALVGREAEIDRLAGEARTLRGQRKEADQRARDAAAQKKAAEEALRSERRRAEALEKKLERMMSTLSDREEKLERRDVEVGRLRDEVRQHSVQADELAARLNAVQMEKAKLEKAAERVLSTASSASAQAAGRATTPADIPAADRQRLDSRIAALTRENRRLRVSLDEARQLVSSGEGGDGRQDLRQQINALAAEVVQLTAMLEAPDSPLREVLANGAPPIVSNGAPQPSIADRVRALRKAAAVN